MSFDLVPHDFLVKIFHRLPFKDRVHLGGVNQQFSYASDESISKMKSLVVNNDLMTYTIKTQSLASLLESCAPTLESIDVSSYSCNRLVVRKIADFVYRNLNQLKIMDAYEDLAKELLSRNRNLCSIALHMSRMKFEWPADIAFKNLEELDIFVSEEGDLSTVFLSPTLCPLISKARNLKRISIKAGSRLAKISTADFKDLLASVPHLEYLSLHGRDCFMLGLFSIRAVQLPSLAFLKINYGNYGDVAEQWTKFQPSLLHKFPASFPRLKSIISDGFKEIDNQAIVALSQLQHLRELRLPNLEMTKQEFMKMVDWLPSLAVLEIGAIKPRVQIDDQVDGETNNGADVAPSQPTHLHELHVHQELTKAVLIDVITHLPSIAILQINAILDVPPELFIDFLTTTAALFRPNEIRLFMPSNDVQFDLNEMKAALKDVEINGGPVVTFNPHRTRD